MRIMEAKHALCLEASKIINGISDQRIMLVLSKRDLDSVLSMKDVIDAVEEGFRQYPLGTVTMPLRSALPVPKYSGATEVHAGARGSGGWAGFPGL